MGLKPQPQGSRDRTGPGAYWSYSLPGSVSPRFSEGPCLKIIRWRKYREIPNVDLWPPQRSYSCIHICTHTYMHTCTHTERYKKNTHFRIFSAKAVGTQAYHSYWPVTHDCHSLSRHPSLLLLITHFQQKRLPTTPASGLTGSPSVSRSRKSQGTDVLEGSYLWL